MTDNNVTREMTFSEELPYFKERIKEIFDNCDNLNGNEDPLYIAVLRHSKRIVRKAEEEINRQQADIERLNAVKGHINTLIHRGIEYPTAEAYEKAFQKALEHLYDNVNAKTEAVKEFAEKLKKRIYKGGVHPAVEDEFMCDIDNLVKEMVRGNND